MEKCKIGVLVGSLRRESFSRKIANTLIEMLPENIQPELVEIGDLQMYNQDFDDTDSPPVEWVRFREKIGEMEGFLFVTPEYNRSTPAVLKNALDIGSRPYGKNMWAGKPGAIVSVSPGKLGAFGANHHLRQSMVFLDVYMMQQPEAYIGEVADCMDGAGNVTNSSVNKFLQIVADAFGKWAAKFC